MSPSPLAPLFAIAVSLAAAASPALAQSTLPDVIVREPMPLQAGHEMKTEDVKFADLNLNSAAGADSLVRRLKAASKRVCSPAPSHAGEIQNHADYKACLNGPVDGAVAAIGNPQVQQAWDRTKK